MLHQTMKNLSTADQKKAGYEKNFLLNVSRAWQKRYFIFLSFFFLSFPFSPFFFLLPMFMLVSAVVRGLIVIN